MSLIIVDKRAFTDHCRLLLDVQSLNDRVGNINGAGDIGKSLLKLINDKTILRPPSPVPTQQETGGPVTNGTESAEPPRGELNDREGKAGSPEKEGVSETGTIAETTK